MGELLGMYEDLKLGDIVYVIYRNPHTQSVANLQQAAVVENPEHTGEKCLFLYETYYPIDDEIAIYKNEVEAEHAFQEYFGVFEDGEING